MIKFKSLNKSSQFLSILKKRKLDTKYFTLFFDKNNRDKKTNFQGDLHFSFFSKFTANIHIQLRCRKNIYF